jgi:hypothetical protein
LSGTYASDEDSTGAYMVLKQCGANLTGTAGPDEGRQFPLANGKIQGNKITGDITTDEGVKYTLDMVVDGEHIKGAVSSSRDGRPIKAKVDLTRVKS